MLYVAKKALRLNINLYYKQMYILDGLDSNLNIYSFYYWVHNSFIKHVILYVLMYKKYNLNIGDTEL